MKNLHKSLLDCLAILQGNIIEQTSFEKYQEGFMDYNIEPYMEYNLEKEVYWQNLYNEPYINFTGRSIGGCLDVIVNLIGTKYDNIKSYISKYKNDGIIWYFDIFSMDNVVLFNHLWQLKNAGYFNYCTGIIFGRPLFFKDISEISFSETIKDAFSDLNIPIIINADIGHVSPQLAIVNGAILEVNSSNGKGKLSTMLV